MLHYPHQAVPSELHFQKTFDWRKRLIGAQPRKPLAAELLPPASVSHVDQW